MKEQGGVVPGGWTGMGCCSFFAHFIGVSYIGVSYSILSYTVTVLRSS